MMKYKTAWTTSGLLVLIFLLIIVPSTYSKSYPKLAVYGDLSYNGTGADFDVVWEPVIYGQPGIIYDTQDSFAGFGFGGTVLFKFSRNFGIYGNYKLLNKNSISGQIEAYIPYYETGYPPRPLVFSLERDFKLQRFSGGLRLYITLFNVENFYISAGAGSGTVTYYPLDAISWNENLDNGTVSLDEYWLTSRESDTMFIEVAMGYDMTIASFLVGNFEFNYMTSSKIDDDEFYIHEYQPTVVSFTLRLGIDFLAM